MASVAIWLGNVRDRVNANSIRTTQAVNLDEATQFMTDAFPIYLKTGVTNSDAGVLAAMAAASAYVTSPRATNISNGVTVLECPVCMEEELKLATATGNALVSAIAAINNIAKMSDAATGRLRWNYGKGVYALGYAFKASNDAAYLKDINNVVWK